MSESSKILIIMIIFFVDLLLLFYHCLEAILLFLVPKKWRFKNVDGEIVLITEGGNGLGSTLAINFAKLGVTVVILDLYEYGLEKTCNMVKQVHRKEAHSFSCDVSDPNSVYDVAKQVRHTICQVTILINNAGITRGKSLLDNSDDNIVPSFQVNMLSHFWTIKAFLPDMLTSKVDAKTKGYGHLVSIASMAGLTGNIRLTDYCASKFAAVGLEESLRLELQFDGYDGIKSTLVCPYFIDTEMFNGVKSKFIPILRLEEVTNQILAGILSNDEVVIIPKYFNFLLVIKALLPIKAYNRALSALGFSQSMENFKGREGLSKNPNFPD